MLANSRQIIKKINHITKLDQALVLIVQRAKSAMDAAACSIYIKETETDQYLLMAAEGLIPTVVGKSRVQHGKGLVGWIAAHKEAINLSNAADHHSYCHILETVNGSLQGFMGTPIIHHGRVLGILVAQKKERRRFDNDEAAFFTTLATQLGEPINRLLSTWDFSRSLDGPSQGRLLVQGIPGAPGVTMGTIKLSQPPDLQSTPDHKVQNIDAEIAIFKTAIAATEKELLGSCERMSCYLPGEVLPLFDSYAMMLRSDKLIAATITRIRDGQWARGALRDTILELAHIFDQIEAPYLAARAEDMRNIGRQILLHLQGRGDIFGVYPDRCILTGVELSLSEISNVPKGKLSGIICTQGSILSHTAIICRALGIPAVMGLADLPINHLEGCRIAVDGNQGIVCINPMPEDISKYRQCIQEENAIFVQLKALRDLPTETLDSVPIPLYVNLGINADNIPIHAEEYDGVGLYRTEFSFIARDTLPTEDEQYLLYRNLLESFTSKPVTIRSLDAGGDKGLPSFSIAETNPFLGWRGIRFTLDHPEIFMTQ
ncbi:MAG: phosphoenolpyruvate-utilizing N-terminal domain-containing protein, partial [Desulfobacteraceae bacterium]